MQATIERGDEERCFGPIYRILVYEPYASGRRTICTCIVELGHQAVEAETAVSARATVASYSVDLVIARCHHTSDQSLLTDIHMTDPTLPMVILRDTKDVLLDFGEQTFEKATVVVDLSSFAKLDEIIGRMSRRAHDVRSSTILGLPVSASTSS